MTIRKRSFVRILCFSWALAAFFGGVALVQMRTVSTYRLLLGAASGRALSGVSRSLAQVEEGLRKSMTYSSSAMLGQSALELATAASCGRASLDCLPLAAGELDEVGMYLSQLSDYAASLGKEAVSKEGMSQQSRDNLAGLLAYNQALSQSVYEAEQSIASGDAEYETLSSLVSCDVQCPTLLYDGRYSSHTLQPAVKAALFEAQEVTGEEARQKAAELLGVTADRLTPAGVTAGNLPTYRFVMGDVSVEVSVAGGQIVSMVNGRELQAGDLSSQEALTTAAAFLEAQGYDSMEVVSHEASDALVTATFAYVGEDVLFYPDSVTVSVAREGGDIVSFSAREYLMHHTSVRKAGVARVKTEGAQSLAPDGHTMESARYAVVSSAGGLENHALELTTSMGEDRYLYYVDALGGDELMLSRLREDEMGRRIN